MRYNDELVEKIIMDLSSNVLELESAWEKNPCAVKKEISTLRDSANSVHYIVTKIIKGAS